MPCYKKSYSFHSIKVAERDIYKRKWKRSYVRIATRLPNKSDLTFKFYFPQMSVLYGPRW